MKTFFLSILLLVLIHPVISQPSTSTKPGYLITNYNDTIWGDIKIVNKAGYLMKIKICNTVNPDGRNYKADMVKGFYYDEQYFESLVWKDVHYFFKRIVKGRTSLYTTVYTSVNTVPMGLMPVPVGKTSAIDYRRFICGAGKVYLF